MTIEWRKGGSEQTGRTVADGIKLRSKKIVPILTCLRIKGKKRYGKKAAQPTPGEPHVTVQKDERNLRKRISVAPWGR